STYKTDVRPLCFLEFCELVCKILLWAVFPSLYPLVTCLECFVGNFSIPETTLRGQRLSNNEFLVPPNVRFASFVPFERCCETEFETVFIKECRHTGLIPYMLGGHQPIVCRGEALLETRCSDPGEQIQTQPCVIRRIHKNTMFCSSNIHLYCCVFNSILTIVVVVVLIHIMTKIYRPTTAKNPSGPVSVPHCESGRRPNDLGANPHLCRFNSCYWCSLQFPELKEHMKEFYSDTFCYTSGRRI
ncbi:hypothetical protein X801_00526, partial [Opisthorchis viverrini]